MVDENKILELVKRSARGEREAFGEIYEIFADRLYNFIFFKVKNKQTAEDLLHTVFLKAWTNLPKYKPQKTAKFSTWLFQVANFTIIDHWRTKKDFIDISGMENLKTFSINPQHYEKYDYLWQAINRLPKDYQTILHLRFKEDLDITEIAKIMNRTQVSVRVLQHRALKALKNLLKPYEP